MKSSLTSKVLNNTAILGVTFCLFMFSACVGGGVDRAGSKGAAGNESTENKPSAVTAYSPNPPVTSASPMVPSTTTENAIPPSAAPRPNNNARASRVPEPQIGTGGNDFFQFTQARAALGADPEFKANSIVIDVKAGVLTLSGRVANAAKKTKAEQLVRAVGGVKEVKNRLRISE